MRFILKGVLQLSSFIDLFNDCRWVSLKCSENFTAHGLDLKQWREEKNTVGSSQICNTWQKSHLLNKFFKQKSVFQNLETEGANHALPDVSLGIFKSENQSKVMKKSKKKMKKKKIKNDF